MNRGQHETTFRGHRVRVQSTRRGWSLQVGEFTYFDLLPTKAEAWATARRWIRSGLSPMLAS